MEKNNIKISFNTAFILIVLVVSLFVIVGVVISKNIKEPKNPIVSNNTVDELKLKNSIKSFKIRFASEPYDTDVEYDFINKTKRIINYTSGTWNYSDKIVNYDKFDELFEYLYNTVFKYKDESKKTSKKENNVIEDIAKPYFDMFIEFNTPEEIPVLNNNWYSYKNSQTNLASWGLNGYEFPTYWNELLNILEIDSSILSDGTTYDFNKSIY